jgi:hypothetical protein
MHLWRRQNGRTLRRRLVAACTLVAYLVASLGLPVPATVAKEAGQAFPCQHHGCGCKSAEQCWGQCCCFSPEQRFAWAESHDVQPPSYAEKPAATTWRTARKRDQVKNCCSEKQPTATSCQTCPETSLPEQPEPPAEKAPAENKSKFRWALGMSALACQGKATLWATTASVLPPTPPVTWAPWPTLLGRISYSDETAFLIPVLPPDPPPRSPLA